MDPRGFFQPSQTVSKSPGTNTMRMPQSSPSTYLPLWRAHLSSMAKNPKTWHAKVKLDSKYKELLHVGLRRSQNLTWLYIRVLTHLINCVRMVKAAPVGALREKLKVANAPGPTLTGIVTTVLGEPRPARSNFHRKIFPLPLVSLSADALESTRNDQERTSHPSSCDTMTTL